MNAYCGDKIWLYDSFGTLHAMDALGFVRYCADELKCKDIVIDNLQKVVDTNAFLPMAKMSAQEQLQWSEHIKRRIGEVKEQFYLAKRNPIDLALNSLANMPAAQQKLYLQNIEMLTALLN